MLRSPTHRRRAARTSVLLAVALCLAWAAAPSTPLADAARIEIELADGTSDGTDLDGVPTTVLDRPYDIAGTTRAVTGATLGDVLRNVGLQLEASEFTELVIAGAEGRGTRIPLATVQRAATGDPAPPVLYADAEGLRLLTGSGAGAQEVVVPGADATLRLQAVRQDATERRVSIRVRASGALRAGVRVRLRGTAPGVRVADWRWTVRRTAPGAPKLIAQPQGQDAGVRLPTRGTYAIVGRPVGADGRSAVAGLDGSGTTAVRVGPAREPAGDEEAEPSGGDAPPPVAGTGGTGAEGATGSGATGSGGGEPAPGADAGALPPPAQDAPPPTTPTPGAEPPDLPSGERVSGILLSAPAAGAADPAPAAQSADAPSSEGPPWRPPGWLVGAALALGLAGAGAALEARGGAILRRARRSAPLAAGRAAAR